MPLLNYDISKDFTWFVNFISRHEDMDSLGTMEESYAFVGDPA